MANTNYKRHDKDNNEVDTSANEVLRAAFGANEGWTARVFKNFNGAYQARNTDNTARTPGTYQARNTNNTARTPAAYQRHDKDNNPVTG